MKVKEFSGDPSELIGKRVYTLNRKKPGAQGTIIWKGETRGMDDIGIDWDDGEKSMVFFHQCDNELVE